MKDFNINTENKDEWLTPPELIAALGSFDLDPCAAINQPWNSAKHHYTIDDSGLESFWYGRIWLNPPYGKYTFQWLEKLSEHKKGLALVFNRSDTEGFQETVLKKCNSLFCLKGRISFYEQLFELDDGEWISTRKMLEHRNNVKDKRKFTGDTKWDNPTPSSAPSVLVSYSDEDTIAILDSGLKGELLIPDRTELKPVKNWWSTNNES